MLDKERQDRLRILAGDEFRQQSLPYRALDFKGGTHINEHYLRLLYRYSVLLTLFFEYILLLPPENRSKDMLHD